MQHYKDFQTPIEILFCDIDDTLTSHGKMGAEAYNMLWKLADSGVRIVPVTGRPAGWCELIARLWPVEAIIGENGAFYFSSTKDQMQRHFVFDEPTQLDNRKKLKAIEDEVLRSVPGCALASDQFTRLFDLAIDFCEDVPPLPEADITKIVEIFHSHGAVAKVSSIHVNGWFGAYDKKTMCETYYAKTQGQALKNNLNHCAFVGDSPNDEPLFDFFKNSFAVANIKTFIHQLNTPPQYVTDDEGGAGFVQLAQHLLSL